ncbi:MAG: PAS domain S-box protein [Candidatus Sumerlaeia bacterium]|nr:PAS domain S-box protein [Candidatus Sumerlaeia bacterium]
MQYLSLACMCCDTQGRLTEWNPAAEQLFGHARADVLGVEMVQLIVPEAEHRSVRAVLAGVVAGDGGFQSSNRNCTKDGRTIVCQWWNTPLHDAAGRVSGVLSMATDITERETTTANLRESNARLTALNRIIQAVATSQDPRNLARSFAHTLREILPVDAFALDIYDAHTGMIRALGNHDTIDGVFQECDQPRFERGFLKENRKYRRIIEQGEPTLVLRTEAELVGQPEPRVGFGDATRLSASLIYVPLAVHERIIGILSVQSYTINAYTEEDLAFVAQVGQWIGPSVESVLLHDQLEQHAQELIQSESRLRAMFDSTHDTVALIDRDGNVLDINTAFEGRFGKAREEVLGQPIWRVLPRGLVDAWRHKLARALAEEHPIHHEELHGGVWHELSVYPVIGPDGAPNGAVLFASDITERKHAEQHLIETNRTLEVMLAVGRAATTSRDPASLSEAVALALRNFFSVDASFIDAYSSETDSIHTLGYFDTIDGQFRRVPSHPHPREWKEIAHYHSLLMDREPVVIHRSREELRRRPNQDLAFGDISRPSASLLYVPLVVGDRIMGILSIQSYTPAAYTPADVELMMAIGNLVAPAVEGILLSHQLREKMRALAESERQYRTLVENLSLGIYRLRAAKGQIELIHANSALATIFGYESLDEFRAASLDGLGFGTTDQERFRVRLKSDGEIRNEEIVLRRKDGIPVAASFTARAEQDEAAGCWWIEGIVEDITERRKADQERTRLAAAIDQLAEGVEITDADGVILYINPAYERLTGYHRAEMLGKKPSILKSGEHPPEFYRQMWETISSGQVWTGRFINRRRTGELLHEEATITPLLDRDGRIVNYVSVKRDVTGELEVENRLRHSQKMEAIGVLAGGIAHDFNNILQGILGFAELARNETATDNPTHQMLREIEIAGQRAAELVSQILTFSRDRDLTRKPLDLNPVVKEALKLLRGSLPSTIEIHHELDAGCGTVMANPVQIHQVLMNLGTNAYHAMRQNGGRLHVSLRHIRLDEDRARLMPHLQPGSYALLEVSDTGTGIDPAIIDRIFEPYFTTRDKTDGSGLGLATVHGIVRAHGGEITVHSIVGKGTTFQVYLPLGAEPAAPEPAHATLPEVVTGHPLVLFVDDEDAVVRLSRLRLQRIGCCVEAYLDSRQALRAFLEAPDRFSLVITDQTMPNLTGIELARNILELRPDIPIILCSGYSDVVDENKAREAGIRGYLGKPFRMQELTAAVQAALGVR